jgi:hypothetical protein
MFLHIGCNFVPNQASWNFLVKFCTQHTQLAVRTLTRNTAKRTPKRTRTHRGHRPAHIHLQVGEHATDDLRPVFPYTHTSASACTTIRSFKRRALTYAYTKSCLSTAGECWAYNGSTELSTGSDAGESPSLLN